MMTFCLKLGAIVKVFLILANDMLEAHRKDQVWACKVLGMLQGQDGFDRLLYFTIDADYAFATTLLTRLQDESEADVSLSEEQCKMCLDACEVFSFHGHVFSSVPNGTFTSSILHGLRGKHILPPGFFQIATLLLKTLDGQNTFPLPIQLALCCMPANCFNWSKLASK